MASIYQFLYFAKLTKISQKDGIRQILERQKLNQTRVNKFFALRFGEFHLFNSFLSIFLFCEIDNTKLKKYEEAVLLAYYLWEKRKDNKNPEERRYNARESAI